LYPNRSSNARAAAGSYADLAAILTVVAAGSRVAATGSRRPLPAVEHLDELVAVEAHRDRAAQRDLLRRVAADDRIVLVEIRVDERGSG
jgi:hypothetical protein